jgi:hypothetical protein
VRTSIPLLSYWFRRRNQCRAFERKRFSLRPIAYLSKVEIGKSLSLGRTEPRQSQKRLGNRVPAPG